MYIRKRLIAPFTALAMVGATPYQLMAGSLPNDNNACSNTAKALKQACEFDVKDDYKETYANCINVTSEDARTVCYWEAKVTKREGFETCKDQWEARLDVCDKIGEGRYADPLLNPDTAFIDPDEIGDTLAPNPYLNLTVGHTYVLRAGENFEETVIVHVTDEIREAEAYDEPVLCRVVVDAVVIAEEDEEDGGTEWVPEEVTDDYFAQDDTGIVYYCGEIARNFEDGYLNNLDGSFFSGADFAKAGVLIRQNPTVGQVDRQEYAIAEAEDVVETLSLSAVPGEDEGGQNLNFECSGAVDGDCLKTFDSAALEPEATEYKYYLKGVGFVLAVAMEDGELTGEREELVCVGDSLEILSTDDCGLSNLGDVDELLETLCELSPEAFCPDDD